MSENAVDKYLRERGISPDAARGVEISELYDPEVVDQYEEEAAAAEAEAPDGPAEQNLVEFYNPFSGMFGGDGERPDPTIIPGVRFPKLGTIATQDFGNFLTIPANIAEERARLGGPLFSFRGEYEPTDKDVIGVIEKYNLRGDDRTLDKLLSATSPEDLEAQAKVYARREAREEQIAVDNPGLVGLATRIGTNVLDPTFWVAGGYAGAALTARIAASSTKTGAAIRFASDGLTKAERFRIGAGTALLVDVPLEAANTAADPSRDILLSAGFVALSPLVGGALSSVGRSRADEVAEAAEALDEAVAKGIMGTDGGAGGAAQAGPVPFTFPEEDLPGAPARAGRFTVGTPLNFLARSADSLTRLLADKLAWNPNTRSLQGVTAAEAQRRIYQAQSVRLRAGRMAAKEYFKTKGFSPSTEQLDEFLRLVGQHMSRVRPSTDPAIIRAADQYREGFADGLAYVQDKDFVPGRERPASGSPPSTPPAPKAPPEDPAPTPPPPPPSPEADEVPETPAPEAPAPEAENDYFGRQSFRLDGDGPPPARAEGDAVVADEAPWSGADTAPVPLADPDAPPPAPPAPSATKPNYFGRKSFRPVAEAAPEPAPRAVVEEPPAPVPVPQVENSVDGLAEGLFAAGADRQTFEEILARVERLKADEVKAVAERFVGGERPKTKNKAIADIRGKFAKDRLDETKAKQTPAPKAPQPVVPPQRVNSVNEKIAMVRGAAQQVIEPAKPAGPKPPTRVDLRTALKGYVDAAEALAFSSPDVPLEIVEAAARARKVLQGFSMGSMEGAQARYVDALERLARALEDAPDASPEGRLLASVVEDLDSGYGSRVRPKTADEGLVLARRPTRDDMAGQEQSLKEAAELYDKYLAEVQYEGRDKRPSAAKDSAVAAVGLGASAGIAAWLLDASEETSAGVGLLGAGIGIALGRARGSVKLRKWERETPGIALFIGPESKGADHKALKKAVQMEASGTDRDTIWKETGWGRSPEGGWMSEIDQPQGELVDDLLGPIKLGDAFKGERLLNLEPDLRKVVLQARSLMAIIEMDNLEGLAFPSRKLVAVREGLTRPQRLRVLLHELNHVLQQKRGYTFASDAEFNGRAVQEFQRANTLYNELLELSKKPGRDQARFEQLLDELKDAEEGADPHYQYLSTAAEAEARLVEARIGLSQQQRRQTPPWKQFDVPEEDLWSGRGAAMAASLGTDLRLFRDDDWWEANVKTGEFSERPGLDGFQYARLGEGENSVYVWVEDYGDGEAIVNWDWGKNVDNNFDGDGNPQLYADNPEASPTEIARAFAFAQRSVERVLKEGAHDVVTFEGAKKAAAGKTASGHERVQKFLMARGQTDGYQATVGSWTIPGKNGEKLVRSSFAFIRDSVDVNEAWQGIRRGKVDIEIIPKKAQTPDGMAARKSSEETPEAPEPADDYRGLEEWRDVEYDPAYIPRRFNKQGWDKTSLSPAFRGNLNKLGNRIGDVIYRSNQPRMDDLGAAQPNPVSGLEMAWRVGRKYADTVNKLMNPARGQVNPYRKITADDREAAKDIVRDALNDGETFGVDQEEAMEMLLDLIAPVKKKSAESPRARPRINMQLDAELDADILDIFEWNVERLYTAYSRNISGYAGLLRAGFGSEAEIRGQIEKIRAQSDRDPKRQRRAEREAEMLELTLDAIIGRPPEDLMRNKHWTWFANQVRRLNFGNLMNNTVFLAGSEVGAALTRVNVFRMIGMFPEFQRYYRQARAGDPSVRENLFYLADTVMGHGSAQLRSRMSQLADRADGSNPSIEDAPQGVFDKIDRFTRKQANLTARLSGMTPMQEFLRMTIVTAEAQDWVKAARNGKPLYSPRRMAALGVDAPMWRRISGELRKWGDTQSPDTGKAVPNMALDQWEDAEALNVFLNALDRNANRLVMEGDIGHQAYWLRNRPSAQLLFQFLNFPMNAFSKHAGFALNTFDMRAVQEMFAMSLGGAVGYTARVLAQGGAQDTEEERNAYYAERLSGAEFGKAMFYYGGHYSLAPNLIDFGLYLGKTAGAPVEPVFTKTRATGLPGDPFTGNPTYSRFLNPNGALKALTDPIKGTPFSEQDIHGLIKHFAPLGNHIVLNAFLDRALEFLPDEEGSVEDQVQN